jgi:diguanylate cyclase (GGDEF)-like protein
MEHSAAPGPARHGHHGRPAHPESEARAGAASDGELLALAGTIRALEVSSGRRLRFPPPIEALFARETREAHDRRLVTRGLLAVVLYDLFLLTDTVMTPDVLGEAAIVRFGVFTPVALLLVWLTHRGVRPALRDGLQSAASLVGVGGFIYIFTRSDHPYAVFYHGGLILALTVVNLVVQLPYRHALAVSTAILAIYALTLLTDSRQPVAVECTNLMTIGASAALTLFASYRLEREQRLTWLLGLRERGRAAHLALDNRRLGRLATRDTLTTLANRRGLETHLRRVLRRPRAGMLSALLVDIDHFKQYNDHYGHQQGDVCLQRVASALAGVPTRSGDMVARFGGEEFVIILPGTDEPSAAAMAERVRRAVSALEIPHADSPVAPVVTVSVGVATMAQDAAGDGTALIEAADAALYRAKAAGRNRVAA